MSVAVESPSGENFLQCAYGEAYASKGLLRCGCLFGNFCLIGSNFLSSISFGWCSLLFRSCLNLCLFRVHNYVRGVFMLSTPTSTLQTTLPELRCLLTKDKCTGMHADAQEDGGVDNSVSTALHIYRCPRILIHMDASEMGRRGAAATNKLLTTEKRRKAAKKGWRNRKARLKELSPVKAK